MSAAKHTPGPWVAAFNRETGVEGVDLSFDIDGDRGSIVRGQSAEHLKTDGQCDDPILAAECEANARLIAAAPELLEALQAMVVAQSMSSYGDPSDFIWPIQTMRKPGEHAYGYLCPSHGLGYTSTCVCCRSDYEEHSANKDRQAVGRRDAALRAAVVSSATAIAKATGAPQ